jgi:aspartyl-tRNA(Asn)/glutamyl-tRNA(Gln) amidotransferase subunit C
MQKMNRKTINKKEVAKTARLAKLSLSQKEIGKFSAQLAEVLANFSQISKINTKNISVTAQVTGLTDVLAEDSGEKRIEIKREKLLANAPESEEGFLVVPRILWKK